MSETMLVSSSDFYTERYTATRQRVMNQDGDFLGMLPADLTAEQVREVVHFANGFYEKGVQRGRGFAQAEMRAALGLAK